MRARLRVLALEPYFGLSHRVFLEGYRRYSAGDVAIWSLPPRKWKWRMRGAAFAFAERALEAVERDGVDSAPDVVLASDFLNVADWLAVAPPLFRDVPVVLYCHENQFTYPLSADAPPDFHYGWINFSSLLASTRVLFNSEFHRREFFEAVEQVLRKMPDHVPRKLWEAVAAKTEVFPVGVDFAEHDEALAGVESAEEVSRRSWGSSRASGGPLLVWNHRWEYDKGIDRLAAAVTWLRERGVAFRLAICGQQAAAVPSEFQEIARVLGDDLVHLGYLDSRREYCRLLASADFVLSTARHEFFGVAVVEAMYLKCLPLLPRALSYPEIVPRELHERCLYAELETGLGPLLERALAAEWPKELFTTVKAAAGEFHWKRLAPHLDAILAEAAART